MSEKPGYLLRLSGLPYPCNLSDIVMHEIECMESDIGSIKLWNSEERLTLCEYACQYMSYRKLHMSIKMHQDYLNQNKSTLNPIAIIKKWRYNYKINEEIIKIRNIISWINKIESSKAIWSVKHIYDGDVLHFCGIVEEAENRCKQENVFY